MPLVGQSRHSYIVVGVLRVSGMPFLFDEFTDYTTCGHSYLCVTSYFHIDRTSQVIAKGAVCSLQQLARCGDVLMSHVVGSCQLQVVVYLVGNILSSRACKLWGIHNL